MTQMRKRQAKAMLDALREPAPLSTNCGRIIGDKCKRIPNRKTRRHSGRYTPRRAGTLPQTEMINEVAEPQEAYDDWRDYRDGLRFNGDKTHLRSEFMCPCCRKQIREENEKVKRFINIRKSKLNKYKIKQKI